MPPIRPSPKVLAEVLGPTALWSEVNRCSIAAGIDLPYHQPYSHDHEEAA